MTIAVCLLTSGRADYTQTTLASFADYNADRPDLMLLHADDGSADDENERLAALYRFETVHRSPERTGGVPALRAMWREAVRRGAERILHLENDWEWTGPVPEIDWPCVRLYGKLKGRGELHEAAAIINLLTREPVVWLPHVVDGERLLDWERALIHFGGPPSIVHADLIMPRVEAATVLKHIGLFTIDTIRPRRNIVWHIGAVTTRDAPQ